MLRLYPFLLLVALSACSASRPAFEAPVRALPDAFPNHTAAQIRERVAAAAQGLDGLAAEGDIALSSPRQSGRFGMRLVADAGGHLYLTIRPGFGIEAARVLVRPDSFFVHNRLDNTLLYGSTVDALAALPVPLSAEDGFATVAGLLVPPVGPGATLRADSLYYYLTSADGRRVVTVDPALWRVVRSVTYSAGGALEEERRFERFVQVDRWVLPQRVFIVRPEDRLQATLVYRKLTPNPAEAPPARLVVGESARRIAADEQ